MQQSTQIARSQNELEAQRGTQPARNAVEGYKSEVGGDGMRILERVPELIRRGGDSLTPAEKELLKWVGVFFRKPTPGKFMMRIRMPNGFATSAQLHAIAELSKRLGNNVLDITTRQQVELRGFTLGSVPEIWEKLRGVDLHSLQTGMDNVRNINGCPLAGISPTELLDASPIVRELDRLIVGAAGNPEFTNLPRKFNITVTGCVENCTHSESQDIALVPARKNGRIGFNVLVGGKMGSGGFTPASSLDVFVEPFLASELVFELVKIYRDHGPREARAKCRFAFLIDEWGISRLRDELQARLSWRLATGGTDARRSSKTTHLGVTQQQEANLVAVGLCVPTGRMNAEQLDELARLAEVYGGGEIRFTTGQNAILPYISANRIRALLEEPLLKWFSASPSGFLGGLVACVGTDYCNLALIETKRRAIELSRDLEKKLVAIGASSLSIHWSGCPAGCGNHQVADIGFRGFKAKIDGKIVDAVAIYAGGRTGPDAVVGKEILPMVPCDERLPEVVAGVIESLKTERQVRESAAPEKGAVLEEVRGIGPASSADEVIVEQTGNFSQPWRDVPRPTKREIIAVLRPEKWGETVDALRMAGITEIIQQRVCGRGRQRGLRYVSHAQGPSSIRYLAKRMLHIYVEECQVELAIETILSVNKTGAIGDGKIFVTGCEEMSQPLLPSVPWQVASQPQMSGAQVG
jgi:ferredoxin-nitrite reductase